MTLNLRLLFFCSEGVGAQGKMTTVLLDAAGRDDGGPAVGEQPGCGGLGEALQ